MAELLDGSMQKNAITTGLWFVMGSWKNAFFGVKMGGFWETGKANMHDDTDLCHHGTVSVLSCIFSLWITDVSWFVALVVCMLLFFVLRKRGGSWIKFYIYSRLHHNIMTKTNVRYFYNGYKLTYTNFKK